MNLVFATVAAPNSNDITLAQLDAESVIDVNKKTITEKSTREDYLLFRELPAAAAIGGKDHDVNTHHTNIYNENETAYYSGLHQSACLSGLVEDTEIRFLQTELQQLKFSVIVFILGPWEYSNMFACEQGIGRRNATVAFINHLVSGTYPKYKIYLENMGGAKSQARRGCKDHTMEKRSSTQSFHQESGSYISERTVSGYWWPWSQME